MRMKHPLTITTLAFGLAVLCGSVGATESLYGVSQTGRFTILEKFGQQAVLDLSTQLIWERSPNPTEVTWSTAHSRCALKTIGGQTGWRLPSFLELMTLVEPLPPQASAIPTLPPGHPFQGIKTKAYWTSDSSSSKVTHAYTVDLLRADVATRDKRQTSPLWCVRGGIQERPSQSLSIPPAGLL
jgi:hypothetical protein